MFILPLHRPFSRARLPWATLLLVLVNVLVYAGLQAGDTLIEEAAARQYVESGLGGIEEPLYRDYIERNGSAAARRDVEQMTALPAPFSQVALRRMIDLDFRFLDELSASSLAGEEAERWQTLRTQYEATRSRSFTWRHLHRGNEIDPWRMLSAAFLHGGLSHLLGNMLFLFVIGALVESALGPWRQLALYAIGALGAGAATLAWRWGTPSAGLGASGAVAAMMGAYCVLWGARKVRFFYWFFVVFDYVRAPAIWLLPAWLGWEVYNLLVNDHLRIGFDAHAGGLVTGALFAWLMRRMNWVVPGFLDDDIDEDATAQADARMQQALQRLGRMELAEAAALLDEVDALQDGRDDVAVARYRIARFAGRREEATQRLDNALGAATLPLVERARLLEDACAHGIVLPTQAAAALLRRLIDAGELERAQTLLAALPARFDGTVQARSWFRLALAHRDQGGEAGMRAALEQLLMRFPHATEAGKARFLLGEGDPAAARPTPD
ncbi:MAG: rhomboid family intramembrane serine protease [Lysobacteraceae bacterium]